GGRAPPAARAGRSPWPRPRPAAGRWWSCRPARTRPRWPPPGPTAPRASWRAATAANRGAFPTHSYGAEVIMEGVTGDNRETFAADLAAERGLHLVHPFDDHDVMAGQGTAALELLEDVPDLDLVLGPVCGGC